jgi:hypothetical protein
LVGKGCWIRHTAGGVFTIEAWTHSAVMLAKDQIDRFLQQKPRREGVSTASTVVEQGWTEVPRNSAVVLELKNPEVVEEVGRFALLEEETPEDEVVVSHVSETPAETKNVGKLSRKAAKKQKKCVVPVGSLGFVDEDAGAFQRHRAWVSRTRYHGGKVSKEQEEHPSLRQHLGRQVTSTMSGVVKVPPLQSFPSLGRGAVPATPSGVWGASLLKVRSDETFEVEVNGGALRLEDLKTPDKATTSPSSVSIPKMQPLSTSSWGDDGDSDGDEAFAQHLAAVAGEYDETEWA